MDFLFALLKYILFLSLESFLETLRMDGQTIFQKYGQNRKITKQ